MSKRQRWARVLRDYSRAYITSAEREAAWREIWFGEYRDVPETPMPEWMA